MQMEGVALGFRLKDGGVGECIERRCSGAAREGSIY